ncbi:MFS transporter [Actinacidiphila paucisporea]|uniref:Predicted arabinose efflux permease, MFS family n=1 Tax=Actinacidiphila paucisporea TaxID=310782 RepID=A0A1M7EVM3_9ACTN|nr:MFS transporter [Actinacidiphila paucisporea]SHL95885.1 Predicted arabinose efflux permease, MFS family [Actinacidiphila paucisporea]
MPTLPTPSPSSKQTSARTPGYRQLLRTPGVWAFVLPGFAARQPFAMLTISLVLLVEHTTGSYGTAGAVAAVTGVAMALCAPRGGRLADRFGQRAVLVPGIALHAASVGALVTLGLAHAPTWALFAAAIPTGATVPQVGPMVRSRWAVALDCGSARPSSLAQTAAAFESVTDEFTFVIGPVLATALCTGVHPAAGLIAEATLTLAGGSLFAAQRKTAPLPHRVAPGSDSRRRSALSVRGVRALVIAFLGIGAVFGGMQVSITAFTEEAGHPGLSGVVYGTFAAGNMLAGVAYGAVRWRRSPRRRLLVAYAALTLACVPLWAVQALPVLAVLGLVVGLCIAPTLITGYTLVDALVPAATRTEAFTWLTGAVALGQAAAVTVAGLLADHAGSRAGFTVPLTGTAVALVMLAGLRGHLVPTPRNVVTGGVIGHRRAVTVD